MLGLESAGAGLQIRIGTAGTPKEEQGGDGESRGSQARHQRIFPESGTRGFSPDSGARPLFPGQRFLRPGVVGIEGEGLLPLSARRLTVALLVVEDAELVVRRRQC